MKKYSFTSENGNCPNCTAFGRRWYIQDRKKYGAAYEYCLMSVSTEKGETNHFKNRKEVAAWLNDAEADEVFDDEVSDYIIIRQTVRDYWDVALIEKDGVQYQFDKLNNILKTLPEHRQESGWCNRYIECLNMAKEILERQEAKNRQLSLFS